MEIRIAASVVALQALALVVAAGILTAKTLFGHPDSYGRALLGAVLALLGAALLIGSARGIVALRPPARSPIIVMQLLALPIGYTIGFQADRMIYGGPILIAAAAVLYLLFTPAARHALDRVL
jgi:hypothetical protein